MLKLCREVSGKKSYKKGVHKYARLFEYKNVFIKIGILNLFEILLF